MTEYDLRHITVPPEMAAYMQARREGRLRPQPTQTPPPHSAVWQAAQRLLATR